MMLRFRTALPDGLVVAEVARDESIPCAPRWCIESLNAGPGRCSAAYDQHLQETVGSSYDWSDELRFDRHTGRLSSFILKTPEAGSLAPAIAASWLQAPRARGLPAIEQREHGFNIDPLDLRCLIDDCSALIATEASLQLADAGSLRLAVDPDVDLLFQDSRYVGWIVHRPIAHLVVGPGDEITGIDDASVHAPLHEYIWLVVQPNIDRMADADPELLADLQVLAARLRAIDGQAVRAVQRAVDCVLDTFYR